MWIFHLIVVSYIITFFSRTHRLSTILFNQALDIIFSIYSLFFWNLYPLLPDLFFPPPQTIIPFSTLLLPLHTPTNLLRSLRANHFSSLTSSSLPPPPSSLPPHSQSKRPREKRNHLTPWPGHRARNAGPAQPRARGGNGGRGGGKGWWGQEVLKAWGLGFSCSRRTRKQPLPMCRPPRKISGALIPSLSPAGLFHHLGGPLPAQRRLSPSLFAGDPIHPEALH